MHACIALRGRHADANLPCQCQAASRAPYGLAGATAGLLGKAVTCWCMLQAAGQQHAADQASLEEREQQLQDAQAQLELMGRMSAADLEQAVAAKDSAQVCSHGVHCSSKL